MHSHVMYGYIFFQNGFKSLFSSSQLIFLAEKEMAFF